MRIESIWIENYRSIRSARLDGLGPFVVLYGENGAGKSNVLSAIQLLFEVVRTWAARKGDDFLNEPPLDALPIPASGPLRIGCNACWRQGRIEHKLTFEITEDPHAPPWLSIPVAIRCEVDGSAISEGAWLRPAFESVGFVPATRSVRPESTDTASNDSGAPRIVRLLAEGRIKQAFAESLTSPDANIRSGLRRLQDVLVGSPLYRPRFDPIHDPGKGIYELNEVREGSGGQELSIPLDLAGLGIQQIYHVLASIYLVGARVVALEEPEAHLHPRTSGLHLRELLQRSVTEGRIDQLFVATHSNLFDLDPDGYFLVEHSAETGTTVERRTDFTELDRQVFWEPGPARHALLDMLRYLDADTVVFRNADGGPVSARNMLDLLQRDDPVAQRFVDDVNTTAVRSVQRLAQRSAKT